MKRILLIEDERNMARLIELELAHEQFAVQTATDGYSGLDFALREDWNVILLDLMLPGMDGLEVCRKIRAMKATPIIMLTARDSITDRVSGLDCGADDYLPKPFAIEELLARIRVIFRRQEQKVEEQERSILQYQDLSVDLNVREVRLQERLINLTKREFDLLVAFMQNANRVLSREMLLNTVWGYEAAVDQNVVDVYVRYLRNKIDSPNQPSYIQTQRGIGYVMKG